MKYQHVEEGEKRRATHSFTSIISVESIISFYEILYRMVTLMFTYTFLVLEILILYVSFMRE